MGSAGRRVVVIGLDGAAHDLVRRWTAVNELPALASIQRRGVWGRLDSVLPYQSVAAWTSFMTGTSPAKHGHFDFVTRVPGTRAVARVNNADTIDGRTLWSIVSDAGKRVGALNVPVTYPVRPLNGFMIPDWLTPSFAKSPTYPPDLADELRRKFGDYLFEFRSGPFEQGRENEARFLRGLYNATEKRAESALYLMETRPWDLFMVVFTGLDTIQHFLWHHVDPTHPRYDAAAHAGGGEILRYYRALDTIVGTFAARVPPETCLFVISDHGFGPFRKQFSANTLLTDMGLLAMAEGPRRDQTWLLDLLERLDVLDLRKRLPRTFRNRAFNWITRPPVDWSRTRAYAGAPTENGIYINLRDREPHGIVSREEYGALRDQIAEALSALVDPESGSPVVERVYRKEDVYQGAHLEHMPDLLLVLAPGYELVERFDGERMFLPPTRHRTGTHRPEGILLAAGPGMLCGREVAPSSLLSVAPTLLYLLDIPAPAEMDGPILDVFEEAFRAKHPVRHAVEGSLAQGVPRAAPVHDAAGQEEVEERLRQLGYLD